MSNPTYYSDQSGNRFSDGFTYLGVALWSVNGSSRSLSAFFPGTNFPLGSLIDFTPYIVPVGGTNLVINGDFHTGSLTPWLNVGPTFINSVGTGGITGHELDMPGSGTPDYTQQTITTIPGHLYTLSYYLKSDGRTPNEFVVKWDGAVVSDQTNLPSSGFAQIFIRHLLASSSSTVLSFGGQDNPGELALCNVSVTDEASAPPPRTLKNIFFSLVIALNEQDIVDVELPDSAIIESQDTTWPGVVPTSYDDMPRVSPYAFTQLRKTSGGAVLTTYDSFGGVTIPPTSYQATFKLGQFLPIPPPPIPPPDAPIFSPAAGSYSSSQSVTITSANSDNIYYTTDGSIPTTFSTLYTGAISIATTTTLRAIGTNGGGSSTITSGTYTIMGCSYVAPSDMQPDAPFAQGFASEDFSDVLWTSDFSQTYSSIQVYNGCAVTLSENGRYIIVAPPNTTVDKALVLTRSGSSFSVTQLAVPAGYALGFDWGSTPQFSISRTGIIACAVVSTSTFNTVAAIWDSGFSNPPTVDTSLFQWNWISADGTATVGVDLSQRVILRDGGDTVVGNLSSDFGTLLVDFCHRVMVFTDDGHTYKVWKLVSGSWVIVGVITIPSSAYSTPLPQAISGDGRYIVGWAANHTAGFVNEPVLWDASTFTTPSTNPIVGTVLPRLGSGGLGSHATSISSDGSHIFGDDFDTALGGTYWLASESYSVAHSLSAYAVSQGVTSFFGTTNGLYSFDGSQGDIVGVSATGAHYVFAAKRHTSNHKSIAYLALPPP